MTVDGFRLDESKQSLQISPISKMADESDPRSPVALNEYLFINRGKSTNFTQTINSKIQNKDLTNI